MSTCMTDKLEELRKAGGIEWLSILNAEKAKVGGIYMHMICIVCAVEPLNKAHLWDQLFCPL